MRARLHPLLALAPALAHARLGRKGRVRGIVTAAAPAGAADETATTTATPSLLHAEVSDRPRQYPRRFIPFSLKTGTKSAMRARPPARAHWRHPPCARASSSPPLLAWGGRGPGGSPSARSGPTKIVWCKREQYRSPGRGRGAPPAEISRGATRARLPSPSLTFPALFSLAPGPVASRAGALRRTTRVDARRERERVGQSRGGHLPQSIACLPLPHPRARAWGVRAPRL